MDFEFDTSDIEQTVDVFESEEKSSGFPATEEQKQCFALSKITKLLKINACAGSGKTSTLCYISENSNEKILVLVYNRIAAMEAREKFPSNAEVRTVHSLAYRYYGADFQSNGKLSRPRGGYVNVAGTGSEIGRFYNIRDMYITQHERISSAFIGLIIRETVAAYENSDLDTISTKCVPYHHIATIQNKFKEDFDPEKFCTMIVGYAKKLWNDRINMGSQVLATHDTYLKMFQLSKPCLKQYDTIMLDEAQDSNPVTLAIFLGQKDHCNLILVGDKYQEIYQWRGSKNALKNVECEEGQLTKAWRYGEKVAEVAMAILGDKLNIRGNESIQDEVGEDVVDQSRDFTVIYRTNINLIFDAVELLSQGKTVNANVDLRDFIKLLESAKELYQGNLKKVKHDSILPFSDWGELKVEAQSVGEINRVRKIIEEGDDLEMIRVLKNYNNTGTGQITLTTAHKSKGSEWDQVILAGDFASNYNKDGEWVGLSQAEENLLYVAATRAARALNLNNTVVEILEKRGY